MFTQTSNGLSITNLHWNFGDGSTLDVPFSAESSVSDTRFHIYAASGTYAVSVVAYDNAANTGSANQTLTNVIPGSCTPDPGQGTTTTTSAPVITSVSTITATNTQTITISGSGFGNTAPQTVQLTDGSVDTYACNVSTPSLAIIDSGSGSDSWSAGRETCTNTDLIGVYIQSWSDTQIVLSDFGSRLGTSGAGTWNIATDDPIVVSVWGPNENGPAQYSTSVSTTGGSVTWTDLSSLLVSPSPRGGSSMVYDVADGYLLLFGGSTSSSSFSDTWTFDGSWHQINPATSPSARFEAPMVYDAADGYVLLFGGLDSSGTYFSDTWKFSGGQWTELHPSVAPSTRAEASMAYDASDGYVVLFGGGVGTTSIYGDTWEFKAGVWTQLHPSSSPAARTGAGMTYDSQDGYVLMFAGTTNPCCSDTGLADTWKFSGGSWTQLSPSASPTHRDGFEFMTYDSSLESVVLFGGWAPAGCLRKRCGRYLGILWWWVDAVVSAFVAIPESSFNFL